MPNSSLIESGSLIVEGIIISLAFQTIDNEKDVRLCCIQVSIDEDKVVLISSILPDNEEEKKSGSYIYIDNLEVFERPIQDSFNNSNKIKLRFEKQKIVDFEFVFRQLKPSFLHEIEVNSTHIIQANFPIEIFCNDRLTSRHQDAFNTAAARWSEIIIGGTPNINASRDFDRGLMINAFISHIDGSGGILGGAVPVDIKAGLILPSNGWMVLDSDDIYRMDEGGILTEVIMHEIGHILGVGTIWNELGLVQGFGSNNPEFIGVNAMREYARLAGSSQPIPVPIENEGQPGVRDSHWRESIFGNELMTSFMGGKSNPISRLTIAALIDIGYQVNLDSADLFGIGNDLSTLQILKNQGSSLSHCSIS